jgi:putative hydrolase of the HAD superfamily
MKNYSRLISLIKERSSPLAPLPVELPPAWAQAAAGKAALGGVKAYLFDVYGTLFISAAGDIGEEGRKGAVPPEDLAFFKAAVEESHRQSRLAGIEYPEVDAAKIWGDEEKALRYELAINPVWPMPGAMETIRTIADKGAVLGIISNAQFFSPLLFPAFFGKTPEQLGFDPGLLIWSYREGEAKPSPRLFAKAAARLTELGIKPQEALYTGNDMKNDIESAAAAGFRTALFAGDGRSLRLRERAPRPGIPNLVIGDLQFLAAGR